MDEFYGYPDRLTPLQRQILEKCYDLPDEFLTDEDWEEFLGQVEGAHSDLEIELEYYFFDHDESDRNEWLDEQMYEIESLMEDLGLTAD